MELNYKNAKFAMAIRDVWTAHDGGLVSFNSFVCGHIYPIVDMYDEDRAVETDKARYYLPIGRHDRGTNEFYKDFILVESEDAEVQPYTNIRKLRADISNIAIKYNKELEPILERKKEEITPFKEELRKLKNSIGMND